jgi:hypothetical protein
MDYKIDTPILFLESLIEDTFNDKIKWYQEDLDFIGKKHTTLINVPTTKKYLKFQVYDLGKSSYVKIQYHKGQNWQDIVEFECIESISQRERIARLVLSIKIQYKRELGDKKLNYIKIKNILDDVRVAFNRL